MKSLNYVIFLYFAEDGPYAYANFVANTPVAVGHHIEWQFNPRNPKESMRIVVDAITHRDGQTILYCEYDDMYEDELLIKTCIYLGVPKDWAEQMPKAINDARNKEKE